MSAVVGRGVVRSPELGEVVVSVMSTITSRFSPLNPQKSPVSMVSVDQGVVESPTSYKAPVVSMDASPAADRVVTLIPQESQVSQLSSMQLFPNRVREDYDFDTLNVFRIFPQCVPCFVIRRPEYTGLTGCTGSQFSATRGD